MTDLSRRSVLGGTMMMGSMTGARGARMEQLAWDFSFPAIEGDTVALSALKGGVLLVVNTASFCGYTSQYDGLQKLHTAHKAQGLTVLGVPSRDFNQESDNAAAVKAFCETNFGIDFPMTSILKVRGPEAHPFYRWVKAARGWEPSWNFNKVVIGRDGRIAGLFTSSDAPDGVRLTKAIAAALTKIG